MSLTPKRPVIVVDGQEMIFMPALLVQQLIEYALSGGPHTLGFMLAREVERERDAMPSRVERVEADIERRVNEGIAAMVRADTGRADA
jgi:hypothetical protein